VSVGAVVLAVLLVIAMAAMAIWRERVREGAATFRGFIEDAVAEVKKITWPDKEQLRQSTLVILGFVALIAVIIGTMDIVLQWIVVTLPSRLV
jgi:preprotein translocase subunit SecE